MSESYSVERNTIFCFEDEAVEGTPPTPDANDAVLIKTGASVKIGREEIQRDLIVPSLSQFGFLRGMYTDCGFAVATEGRASGTHGTPPEIQDMLKNVMGDQNNGTAATVTAVHTASTSAFTVLGAALTDEDDILVEIGTHWEAQHIDSLSNGTGIQTIGLLATTSIAPVHTAEVIDNIEDGTVKASPSPTTTAFTVTGGTMVQGDQVLVEVTGSSGYYYLRTVDTATPGSGEVAITVTPALPAAPTTGDSVVIYAAVTSVLVNAAPSTSAATLVGGTLEAGHILRIQTSSTEYEYARCTAYADNLASWWPPVSVAPTAGYNVYPGVKFALKSDYSDFVSGCGYFFFDNGSNFAFPGSRGKVTMTLEIGKPLLMEWDFMSLGYDPSFGTRVSSPVYNLTTQPPLCLGILAHFVYEAVGANGSTTTNTILAATPDLEAAIGDTLIIDRGSGVYETQPITAWNYTTQTATTAAFGGALPEGEDAYIRRCLEISKLTIEIAPEWTPAQGMCAQYGNTAMIPMNRIINVSYDKHFKSNFELLATDAVQSVEIMAVYGDQTGNIIAVNLPNVLRKTIDYALDGLQGETVNAQAFANSTTGDDEAYITYL